jgi:hypothetical protein
VEERESCPILQAKPYQCLMPLATFRSLLSTNLRLISIKRKGHTKF